MRRTFQFYRIPTRSLSLVILGFSSLLLWLPYLLSLGHAQVPPPITPSGLNTQVNLSALPPPGKVQYDITGGTRPGGGANLFHSFGLFGVPTNNIANFLNETPAVATSNILGRVTGGNVSNIFGTIQTTGFGNANLFLMNPAGFLFGPNATVNVGGLVAFTSADYLKLTDSARFNAVPNVAADALLTASPVAAFGFLGSNPGAITIQGSEFTVTEGTGISLVGGDITIEAGTLVAPAGRINLASVASPGEILAGTLDQVPNINGQSFSAMGAIEISEGSVFDVSGDGGGTVTIRGGRFVLDESEIVAFTTGPALGPPGSGIDIVASEDALVANSFMEAFTETADNGGAIRLKANGNLEIEGGFLDTGTEFDSGHAGNIELTSTNGSIVMTDSSISSLSFGGDGNSGNIELTSLRGNISLLDSSLVTSQTILSEGNAGAVRANAPEGNILLADNTQLFNATRGGNGTLGELRISANNLTVLDSGISGDNFSTQLPENMTVNLSGTLKVIGGPNVDSFIRTISRGPAAAADLNITAKEVLISDSGLLSTETLSAGAGGHLNILADIVQLTNGGQIRSGSTISPPRPGQQPVIPSGAGGTITIQGRTSPADSVLIDGPGSGIITDTQGIGAGGSMNISARSLTIQNGGTISASTSGTAPSATGGSIAISSIQSTTLNNGASVTASSTGPANAGSIVINAGQNYTSTNSSVTTQAAQASGGNITVLATDSVQLTNSQINASVQGAQTTVGGNIVIDPQFVILQNSQILAQATQGQGGNISITTGLLLADAISAIDASSQFGVNGNVTVQSPISQAGGKIQQLGKSPLQATSLLSQRCAALAGGEFSSFTVAGRDTLPAEPGGWLASPLAVAAVEFGGGPVSEVRTETEGSSRLSGSSGLSGVFGSRNEINQIDQTARGGGHPPSPSPLPRWQPPLAPPYQGGKDSEGETTLLSLRQIAPPGFLTQAFAVDWSAGCTS